jgi:GT2 family glycosyltransferase
MTTLSILIPTRNRLPYLVKALASARVQREIQIEILVSDDGSTDGTLEMLHELVQLDPRVRLLPPNPIPGIFQNVTHLIGYAQGELYTILGDDDLLDPDFGMLVSRPLVDDREVIAAFTDHRVIDASGRILSRASAASSRRFGRKGLAAGRLQDPMRTALDNGIWLGFTVYRRATFQHEPFDLACGPAADWDLSIRAARAGPVVYVPGPLASYRDHSGTASRRSRLDASVGAVRVLEKHHFDTPHLERHRVALLRDRLQRLAFQAAPTEPALARRALAKRRDLGGPRSAHVVAAEMILHAPVALRGPMHATLTQTIASARALSRAVHS